ncbi:conserved hypothetical protein [Burkholderia cepacia]
MARPRSFTRIPGTAIFDCTKYDTPPPYNTRHVYAIAIPLAGMPRSCERYSSSTTSSCSRLDVQNGWMAGEQNALETTRLESTLLRLIASRKAKQAPERLFC